MNRTRQMLWKKRIEDGTAASSREFLEWKKKGELEVTYQRQTSFYTGEWHFEETIKFCRVYRD